MLQKVTRASEHNLVLVLGQSYVELQLQEESEKSLRRIRNFSKHLLFYPPSHLAKVQLHVSTTAMYFSFALTNAVLLITMANAPAKIVVPACHLSW